MFVMGLMIVPAVGTVVRDDPVMVGWRMRDRFMGFRYEIFGAEEDVAFAVRGKADDYGCFGWIQDSPRGSYVGEARCAKDVGNDFKDFLTSTGTDFIIKDYEDTKIKLHFSHFKVLPASRTTCFPDDEPHKCHENDNDQQQEVDHRRTEL